jgi:hypothetical protein
MFYATILVALLAPLSGFNSYFEDFNDGIADGWTVVHGDWDVPSGTYRGIGRFQSNSVHNISFVPATAGADCSVEAVMHGDAGFDDVSKMLVLRYNDPNNFYFVSFRAGWRHDVVVERVYNGVRSYITPEFLYNIPEHNQTQWKRVRADIIGDRVIAYFEGVRVMDIKLPEPLITTGMAGINTFSSGGGDEEIYADEYSWALAEFAPISYLTRIIGGPEYGGQIEVSSDDNSYYTVSSLNNPVIKQPAVKIEFGNMISFAPVREANLRFESSVSTGSANQVLELWDWPLGQWVRVDSRNIGQNDLKTRLALEPRFRSSFGFVKGRANYYNTRPRSSVKIDEIIVHAVAQ